MEKRAPCLNDGNVETNKPHQQGEAGTQQTYDAIFRTDLTKGLQMQQKTWTWRGTTFHHKQASLFDDKK